MKFSKILTFFSPKDREFFPLFEESADILVQASEKLLKLVDANDDAVCDLIITDIKTLELKGDSLVYQIQDHLNKSFLTPFDREDIQQLSSMVDDILDYINNVSQKFLLYRPIPSIPEFKTLAEIINKCCKEIQNAIICLKSAEDLKTEISSSCKNINALEKTADDTYHIGIANAFKFAKNWTVGNPTFSAIDAVDLIKIKGILESLEKTTDKAEDVSDIIQTILVKII